MLVYLNIDVWKDRDGLGIYVKQPPEGALVDFIKAGTPIEHNLTSPFIKRIKDQKIIFGPSCLPPIDRSGEDWHWKGFANR